MHAISAIVVNFDGGRELLRCVASLSVHPRRFAEVIVVDNASSDGSPECLLESHPDVVLLRSERNVGPAAARNVGLRRASSPLVLFIDDDVRLEPGALDRLLDCRRRTDATVVVPRLVLVPENVVQADGADVHFTGTMHLRNSRAPLAGERPPARPIGAFSSSCVLAERRRLLDAGGFDESFFIYQEDMELGLRLRAFGHALYCEPAAVALHERGGRDAGAFLPRPRHLPAAAWAVDDAEPFAHGAAAPRATLARAARPGPAALRVRLRRVRREERLARRLARGVALAVDGPGAHPRTATLDPGTPTSRRRGAPDRRRAAAVAGPARQLPAAPRRRAAVGLARSLVAAGQAAPATPATGVPPVSEAISASVASGSAAPLSEVPPDASPSEERDATATATATATAVTGRRYRVAVVAACPFPCGRGTPVRIQRMAEELARRGHELTVVTYHLREPLPVLDGVRVRRIRDVPSYRKFSPGPSPRKLLFLDTLLVGRLRELLREGGVDVIHAHHFEGLIVALLARRSLGLAVPIVFDAHTLLESELPYYVPRPLRRALAVLGRLIDRTISNRAEHVVAVTDDLREHLLAQGIVAPADSTTVDNGVELEPFATERWTPRAAGDDCLMVFTGNLAGYQGIEQLLEALAAAQRERLPIRLRIVTQSSFGPYEALAERLGVRRLIELVDAGFDAVPHCLATADIAVNPRVEAPGLPQKTLNYMAAGMPIVSFAGSGQHLVHGVTALLVPGSSARDLAAAIVRLADDPALAAALGAGARAEVESKSWTLAATRVEGVYARLLGGKGGGVSMSETFVPDRAAAPD